MSFSDNPFALLDDDAPAAPRGPAAVKQVQQQQAQKPAVAPSRPAAGDNRGENNAAARGGNKSRRGGRGGNSNVARSSNENSTFPVPCLFFHFLNAAVRVVPVGGHESHPRGTRPRRGRRGGWHGHGREFDRHSGMLPDSDKKVKQGWGDPTNVAEETTNGETVTPGEFAGENADANNNAEAPEEVEVVKTLEEYLAEKASLKSTKTSASIRKPNEGVDESKWKGAVPLERKEEEDPLFAGKQNKVRPNSSIFACNFSSTQLLVRMLERPVQRNKRNPNSL